jgi:hypothetical protein
LCVPAEHVLRVPPQQAVHHVGRFCVVDTDHPFPLSGATHSQRVPVRPQTDRLCDFHFGGTCPAFAESGYPSGIADRPGALAAS